MGRYTLFNDFLFNGMTTHFEVWREMKHLGIDDDDRLLVPVLFYLGISMEEKSRMRERHRERKRGLKLHDDFHDFWFCKAELTWNSIAVRMLQLSLLLRKLRGHNYNIYECCFLAFGGRGKLLRWAAFSLIAQILLLFILMYYNMSDIANVSLWRKDWGTILVIIVTTVFFAKLVYEHGREAYNFSAVFRKPVLKELLAINILVNWGLGILVVLFNIFFLLISKGLNEAIVNSLALLFILEIDDMLRPEWDEAEFDFLFAERVFFSCDWDSIVNLHVDIKSSVSPQDCYLHLLESDDKADFIVRRDVGRIVLTMYWRRSQTRHDIVQFHISGADGREFFESILNFGCVARCLFMLPVGETKDLVDWDAWSEDLEEGVWDYYEWGG